MKKKLLIILTAALSAGLATTHAQTAPAPATTPGYGITVTGTAVSSYMFRGQRLGGWAFQPSVEYATGNLGVGIWSNIPIKDAVPDTSDPEFDFYAYYTAEVNDAVSLVPAFTYYYYPRAPLHLGFYRASFEPSIALNYTVGGLKLTPKAYYDFVLKGPTYELNAFYALPLTGLGTELDFTGSVGTYKQREVVRDGNPRTKAWGDYWSVGAAVPFQLSPEIKLTVGWMYTEGKNAYFKTGPAPRVPNSLAVDRHVFTVSFAHSF